MNNNFRYILAGLLIFLILLLQPAYLKWLGYDTQEVPVEAVGVVTDASKTTKEPFPAAVKYKSPVIEDGFSESFITVVTPLYSATLSNRSGGSLNSYTLTQDSFNNYKYKGGYDDFGVFDDDMPVSLILSNETFCLPCLAVYDAREDQYDFINTPFRLLSFYGESDTVFLTQGESVKFNYVLNNTEGDVLIEKSLTFSADNFISRHDYKIYEDNFDYINSLEIMWAGGLRPSERRVDEDVQYGSGIIGQAGEIESIQTNDPNKKIDRRVYNGQTDWVAVRSKYFMSALLADHPGSFATLSAENVVLGDRKQTPLYSASVGFPLDVSTISSRIYLGPLDVDHISSTGTNLDATMNWGWAIIRPISKGILWVLKFMHNTLHLNYGLALLLFAFLVRLITGPLTKKSFESTQKMQKLQPELKKMQAKYKSDPQRLNRETMGMYKKHGVNPLGGCLPMLLQMPLLMALFIVFRTTIEFRGQPFVFWITDLSKPDIVFSLPFTIPVYGDGIAILPLLMGATLFLTMRMSSATMDKNQKPIMYFMNGFFILLFNSFPSGLNLYYTTYNLMSFLQQRSIKNKLGA